jgi:hypothetical protein
LPRQVANVFHCIKSEVIVGAITQSASANVYGALNFSMANNVPDYTSLAAVYDQYRLMGAELIFRPRANMSTVAISGQPYTGGFLYTVIDYDDSTVLSSTSAAQAYATCIISGMHEDVRRSLKPRMAVAAYTGSFTGYTNMAEQWIDCTSTGVLHYGIKYAVDQSPTAAFQVWDLIMRTEWEFKGSR